MITSLLSRILKPHWATYWLSFLNKAGIPRLAPRQLPSWVVTNYTNYPHLNTMNSHSAHSPTLHRNNQGSSVCHDSRRNHLQGSGGRRRCTAREGDGSIVRWVALLFVMILGMFRGKSNRDRAWINPDRHVGPEHSLRVCPCWFQAVLTSVAA